MVSPRSLRPFIDGTIPAPQQAQRLLMPARQDSTAVFLSGEGDNARVYYPVDSTNEVVAPAQPGIYPQPGSGGIVPVLLGSDGRISQVLPPLSVNLSDAEGVGDAGEAILSTRNLARDHDERLVEVDELIDEINEHNRDVVDPFIRDTDHALTVDLPAARQAAQDAQDTANDALYVGNLAQELAQGKVWVDEVEPPFDSRVDGQIWIRVNADGQMVGVYRLKDATTETAEWDVFTVLTGLLIVPGENGTPTIVDQNGITVGQIMADSITAETLAAGSVGAKQLVIGEINREHLTESVDGILSGAQAWADRVVIEPGSITISRSAVDSESELTALRLEANRLDFIVAGESIAYMDSEKNLMSIGNAYIRDTLQVGEHQVRRLGAKNLTVFQWVGGE